MSTAASRTPLTDASRARVEATIAKVKEQMPELADDIKALRAAGFDVGWRDVAYIGPHRPAPPGAVAPARVESMESIKERMRKDASRNR